MRRAFLANGDHGLGDTQDAGPAVLKHVERGLLRRGAGGAGLVRETRGLNTDQGSQFTGFAFTSVLRDAEVRISMDGRGDGCITSL